MLVILCFDKGDGDVRLVIENVISPLGFAASDQFTPNDDPAFGEGDFLTHLERRSHPAWVRAGVMNFVQMSRSVRSFLFIMVARVGLGSYQTEN